MHKNYEILELALSYTENNPDTWFKGGVAGDGMGHSLVDANDPDATCWCTIGLLTKAATELNNDSESIYDVMDFLYPHVPGEFISVYNDAPETTHADIVNMFKKGIADAKAKEVK